MHDSINPIVGDQLIEDRIAATVAEHQAREPRARRRHGPRESAVQGWLHEAAAARRARLPWQRVR